MKLVDSLKSKYDSLEPRRRMALWIMLVMAIQRGVLFLTVPIFTRIMSREEYGLVSTYVAWEGILEVFATFKLQADVYNKGMAKYEEDRDRYCLSMQYAMSLFTVGLLAVYLIFHGPVNAFTELSTPLTVGMFLQAFFSAPLTLWTVRDQYRYRYKATLTVTLVQLLVYTGLGVTMVLTTAGNRGEARIWALVISQVLFGGGVYIRNMIKGGFRWETSYAASAIRLNLPMMPHYLSEFLLSQSDRVMIQKLTGYGNVALYSLAYNTGMLLDVVSISLRQALMPWVYGKLEEGDHRAIGKRLAFSGGLILLPVIMLSALAPEVVHIYAGSKYDQAVYAVPPIAGSVFFLYLYNMFTNVEIYYDANKMATVISAIGAGLNILLNFLLIPVFGYVAAGYTTFACYFLYALGHYLYTRRVTGKRGLEPVMGWPVFLAMSGVVTVIVLVISGLYPYPFLRYLISTVALGTFAFGWKHRAGKQPERVEEP